MTKLWVLSDLHLESVPHPRGFTVDGVDFDVLVSAGDAWSEHPDKGIEALRRLAGDRPVVAIPGNHCSWGRTIPEAREVAAAAAARHGVTWLDDAAAEVAGVRFVGSTLWSGYDLSGTMWLDRDRTGDDIEVGGGYSWKHLKIGEARRMHADARRLLEVVLANPCELPTVVVTHMAPHPDCVGTARNAFHLDNSASDLSHLTDEGPARLWLHGHVHSSSDVARPNGSRLLRNAAGTGFRNHLFDERLVIDVPTPSFTLSPGGR